MIDEAGLLARFERVKRNGVGWVARCPAHEDRNPSLSISCGDTGCWLLTCHAGCEFDAIIAAAGLDSTDLFPDKKGQGRETRYPYYDEKGKLLYTQVRVDYDDGTKKVRTEPRGVKTRSLYRLDELLHREPADRWVLVVEGEKCVNRLVAEGFVATTNSHGAEKWADETSRYLAGARVAILGDNDEPGRRHVTKVAASLRGQAAAIRIVKLTGLPSKGDVVDWLNAGHTAVELKGLVLEAPEWEPEADRPLVEDAGIANDLSAYLRKYVVMDDDYRDTVALWILHCWAIDAFYTTGRLLIRSPEKECGKSVLLDVMEAVLPEAISSVSMTGASMFQRLDGEHPPVFLIDELDTSLGSKRAKDSETMELLKAVLNGGYRRGRTVDRGGKDGKPKQYPTFAPVALAGIASDLSAPFLSRAIIIEMRKRLSFEECAGYAWGPKTEAEAKALQARCEAWASTRIGGLREAEPEMPEEIAGRKEEIWGPLFAVADAIGGDWPDRIRDAAENAVQGPPEPQSTAHEILVALREVFDDEVLSSKTIVDRLKGLEEYDFHKWNNGSGITQRELALRLATYRIRPRNARVAGEVVKGYRREQFTDAWARYAPIVTEIEEGDPSLFTPASKRYQPLQMSGDNGLRESGVADNPVAVADGQALPLRAQALQTPPPSATELESTATDEHEVF